MICDTILGRLICERETKYWGAGLSYAELKGHYGQKITDREEIHDKLGNFTSIKVIFTLHLGLIS